MEGRELLDGRGMIRSQLSIATSTLMLIVNEDVNNRMPLLGAIAVAAVDVIGISYHRLSLASLSHTFFDAQRGVSFQDACHTVPLKQAQQVLSISRIVPLRDVESDKDVDD